jgi:hypothetical protein
MVAAALRARQALHAADAAARPGAGGAGTRWQAQPKSLSTTCAKCSAQRSEPALVLLGPPGCGKSTLLRRLELDLALDALRAGEPEADAAELLRAAQPLSPGAPRRGAADAARLAGAGMGAALPQLPALGELLQRRLVLLLDAVNELPHSDEADYRERIALWRDFVAELPAGTRVLFSCRSLDYSASLSTPEAAGAARAHRAARRRQVEQFLTLHDADGPGAVAATARYAAARPLPLAVLPQAAARPGRRRPGRPAGPGGAVHRLRPPGAAARDRPPAIRCFAPARCSTGATTNASSSRLAQRHRPAISAAAAAGARPARLRAAGAARARRSVARARAVRRRARTARARGTQHGDDLLHAGVALQVLEVQWDDVLYVHQLLQEYFAARALAAKAQPELVASAWRADAMAPSLAEVLAGLADSDPLPEAPTTGWEETFVLAAAIAPAPEASSPPDGGEPAARRPLRRAARRRRFRHAARRLQQALVERSRDPPPTCARASPPPARSANSATRASNGCAARTATTCCRRWWRSKPALPIGSDEGLTPDEAPAHA